MTKHILNILHRLMSTFSSPCMILISFSRLKNIFLISIANFWKYISRNIYDCYDCPFVMYPLSQKKTFLYIFFSSPMSIKMYGWVIVFIRPFEKRDVLCRGNVRPSVRVFRTFLQHALRYQIETWYIHSVGGTTCRVASQLGHFDLVYSQK